MKILYFYVVFVFYQLYSCKDKSHISAKSYPPQTITSPETATSTSTQNASLLVDNASHLPPCEASLFSWLVFLKEEREFRVCGKGGWEEVDVRGARGKQGEPGAPGQPVTITVTETMTSTAVSVSVENGIWVDSATNLRWVSLDGEMYWSWAKMRCAGAPWRLPTVSELKTAIDGGLLLALPPRAASVALTADVLPNQSSAIFGINVKGDNVGFIGGIETSTYGEVYCVAD